VGEGRLLEDWDLGGGIGKRCRISSSHLPPSAPSNNQTWLNKISRLAIYQVYFFKELACRLLGLVAPLALDPTNSFSSASPVSASTERGHHLRSSPLQGANPSLAHRPGIRQYHPNCPAVQSRQRQPASRAREEDLTSGLIWGTGVLLMRI
jgi:hypothetical protein